MANESCSMDANMNMSVEFNIMQLAQAYNLLTAVGASQHEITLEERGNARKSAKLIMSRLLDLLEAE